jgi:hypothetical protein
VYLSDKQRSSAYEEYILDEMEVSTCNKFLQDSKIKIFSLQKASLSVGKRSKWSMQQKGNICE